MRILLIAPRFHTNQVSFVRKLIEEKHEVGIYVIGHGISEDHKYLTPVEIPVSQFSHWLNRKAGTKDFAKFACCAFPKLFKYLRMVKAFAPDVIIIRGASTPVYAKMLIPFALIMGMKIVFYTQGPKYVRQIKRIRKAHDWLVINVLKVRWFTPVLYRGDVVGDSINLDYIEYVPFFIYPQIQAHQERETPVSLNFICVGKYEPRKNIKLLIEALKLVFESTQDFKLTIIGSCDNLDREIYYRECLDLIRTRSLEKNVMLLKNIPYNQMEQHYLKNHIMVLPSVNEPASISELEAMSYGLGVISSKDNGSAHYLKNGKNGFIIDVNTDELVKVIIFYINNPQFALLHGQESLRMIKEELSVDESYKKLLNVINS